MIPKWSLFKGLYYIIKVLNTIFFFLFPGIKVSAEPLHEDTIVTSQDSSGLRQSAEPWLKCTESHQRHSQTRSLSSQHLLSVQRPPPGPPSSDPLFLHRIQTSNNCHPSQWCHWFKKKQKKNEQSVVRTRRLLKKKVGLVFFFPLWKWWHCFIIY